VGDPFDETTDVGPLATEDGLKELDADVQKTTPAGARLLIGGKALSRPGNYHLPTVLTNIDDAIRIANASPFGLGASAWTNDST
jgi:succinate-semialdehyde dehydrogenase / glutarate-semialdehyde dehydrogenase